MEKFVYQGQYIQVSEQTLDGIVWEKVYLKGGISIFPIQNDGRILMIEEKRPHESPTTRFKNVTGIYEPEYSLEENANREMQEEIGFKAEQIDLIQSIKTSGTVNNFLEIVLARGLKPSKLPNPDGEDTIQKIIPITLEELMSKTMENKIPWSLSTLGVFALYHNRHKFDFA